MVLLQHPLTYRDVVAFVAQAQRTFLDIYAFLDFVEVVLPHTCFPTISHPVRLDWMGCFTRDTTVCDELFLAGVPVWLACLNFMVTDQTIIEKPVAFSFPDHIVRAMYSERGKPIRPFDLLYCCGGGLSRHVHSRRHYMGTMEPTSTLPTSLPGTSNVGKAPTHTQTRKAEQKWHGRQKHTQSGEYHIV
ncbi:hypothetical protein L210DRAFT_3411217 [Boletus edulis BED1]|uniref:Uncharacterized protein n=1 Tax=Boletus edulis BED1 TaxID=1328754 RepID=A0AAD4GB20_BOLED|nr:hypothetical protein L210DRAFT_3411217 [Boletus edulis BED1]